MLKVLLASILELLYYKNSRKFYFDFLHSHYRLGDLASLNAFHLYSAFLFKFLFLVCSNL
jgi:hypothetical protein